ncbi:MAG: hypothetical protein FJX47_00225 [Alphaproteobacteria bacterium]|nr:hypothetical protein [Alphaproteobacteria bacterium]
MNNRFLFVVAEIGAARYFLPLWRRWLATGAPAFRIILGAMPATYLRDQGLGHGLPVVAELATEAGDIGSVDADCLVASAGLAYPIELAAIRQAREAGIPSLQAIDSWLNYRRRFEHSGLGLVLPDRILVIDDKAVAEALGEGLPGERLVAIGQPSWEQAREFPSPPQARRTLFLSGPVRRQYGDSLGYDEISAWELLKATAARHPSLVGEIWYGRHPVQTEITEDMVAPARLITESMAALAEVENVVGIFSSPMIDALIGGRRVVSLQPGARGLDMCPLSRHGRIRRAGTVEELRLALEEPARSGEVLIGVLAGSLDRLERVLMECRI